MPQLYLRSALRRFEANQVNVRIGVANALVALWLLAISHAQTGSDLSKQMEAIHVHTALLIRSQEMDDLPAWSPDGRFLAVNLAGKWVKVDVSATQLQEAKWHEQRVGVQMKADLQPLTDQEVHSWPKADESQIRKHEMVTTASGLKVEMRHKELSSALVVSKGKQQAVIWALRDWCPIMISKPPTIEIQPSMPPSNMLSLNLTCQSR